MTTRAPATDQQFSVWMMQTRAGHSPMFNLAIRCDLTGPLDQDALVRAVDDLVDRHEALRTTFALEGGQLWQLVGDRPGPVCTLLDGAGAGADVDAAVAAASTTPFRLATELPVRAVLARLDGARHLLLMVFHHIAVDAWSLQLLFDELARLYRARLTGTPAPLPPAGRYRDHAHWQRTDTAPRRAVEYWLGVLAGAEAAELPATVPPEPGPGGSLLRRHLPADLFARCASYAASRRTTTFTVLAAAFARAVRACTGRSDVLFTTNAANRQHDQHTVGLFITTLPIRVRVDPEGSFDDLVDAVWAALLDGHEHECVPFSRLAARLRAAGDGAAAQLPLMFISAPALPAATEVDGLLWEWAGTGQDFGTSTAGVSVIVSQRRSGGTVIAEYDRSRYHPVDVERLLDAWQDELTAAMDTPAPSAATPTRRTT